ncbi:MAG: hypothetical protein ACYS5V_14480 [Planctomycetota bacterium]|jgi:hypothetical protein
MRLGLFIRLDDDAIQQDPAEAGRILSQVADIFHGLAQHGLPRIGTRRTLRDANGNAVGEWRVTR